MYSGDCSEEEWRKGGQVSTPRTLKYVDEGNKERFGPLQHCPFVLDAALEV